MPTSSETVMAAGIPLPLTSPMTREQFLDDSGFWAGFAGPGGFSETVSWVSGNGLGTRDRLADERSRQNTRWVTRPLHMAVWHFT